MKSYCYFLFLIVLFIGACEDPIQLGAGLVQGEVNDPEFTDTIDLVARTIMADPPITFRNSSSFSNSTYLVGEINDPVFGRYSSVAYFDAFLSNSFPELENSVIDSVILVLALDSLGQYGDENEVHNLELYQLEDVLDVESGDTLLSDLRLEYSPTPLGSFSGTINFEDSLTVYSPTVDTLIQIPPELRVPLDVSFWDPVARDTLINASNETLAEYLKGFALVSTTAQNSMVGLGLSGNAARVDFYYTTVIPPDTAKAIFSIFNGLNKHSYFEHDYSGTEVEAAIGDSINQEYIYLHSMAGVNIEFDLAPLLDLTNDVVINNAVLELSVKEDDPLYPPINRLLASYYNDGVLFVVEDIALSSDFRFFGGRVNKINIDGIKYDQYNLNITNHLNNLLNGSITETDLIISSFSTQEQARRSVIYGRDNQVQPARLKLIITKP